MAGVAAHSSQTKSDHPPHGIKRAGDGSLEHEQRLSKRFDLLNLGRQAPTTWRIQCRADTSSVDDNGTRLFIGIPGSSSTTNGPISPVKPKKQPKPRRPPADDAMLVEDTPHRVYIHDLAAELSDIESDEDTPIFLPDIEKHLSKIPRHLLRGPEPKATEDNQLVLYNVPTSLSVPQEQDNVRKAIVEARQRIREKQVNPTSEPKRIHLNVEPSIICPPIIAGHDEEDEDAMDID